MNGLVLDRRVNWTKRRKQNIDTYILHGTV